MKFSSLQLQEVLGDILQFSIKAAKSDQESDKYISSEDSFRNMSFNEFNEDIIIKQLQQLESDNQSFYDLFPGFNESEVKYEI